ncbi:signal peptide peptidase SppA [Paraflavitalea sp. CAU 1676]|uniref:signal peptide peptidase SppA n=1 Tax=Paraflavitalea sp. CAU 1676 TaxID=3032598 RepID=UPI0023DAE50B|nr:signal peptide peptidase SppA [Paraflavitalea sp. CAU 1676]MDF2189947.1 signal peptide peptidase SppA [Paraflavitalea sp. CAU 1676]
MNSFLKIFLASLAALFLFTVIMMFITIGFLSGLATPKKESTGSKAVLMLDLSQPFTEVKKENPLAGLGGKEQYSTPALYEVVRLIRYAKSDSSVKGIYINCGTNSNGFATGDELRQALLDFKAGGKFIYAYADVINQNAYYVANVANKVYCNPKGGLDWRGFSMQMVYLKGTLQKLEIEPQIFYAGKFKSATEPFREEKMTDANRLQSTVILNDLYGHFLLQTSATRKLDTALLHQYANENRIQFANDALQYKLVDGLKYDDEVKDEIKEKLSVSKYDKINFVSLGKYAMAVNYKATGEKKIAVIYAEGDIVDGKGDQENIGGDTYRNLIRKARLDTEIKAIVIRINSGGGSAMASENMWREIAVARQDKPVIVSFGDVAASGGYYMACGADSIFAQPNTITGSIGVFTLLPNMQSFFKNKLGMTFDGVKTSPDADALSVSKPLTPAQRQYLQNDVDTIYQTFKQRVAAGRKKSVEYIDSIGQGRIWSGSRAVELGLVDRIGGLDEAIEAAAKLAKVSGYGLKEFPEPRNIFELIFGDYQQNAKQSAIREELGAEGMKTYNTLKRAKAMVGVSQARLPFDFSID